MKEEIILELKETAKKILIKDMHLKHVFILEKRNGQLETILPEMCNDKDKEITTKIIGGMLKGGEYKSFLQICEAWTLHFKDISINDDKISIPRPSQCPEKREAIVMMYKEDDGSGFIIEIIFRREGLNFIFEKEQITKNNSGDKLGGKFWDMWS